MPSRGTGSGGEIAPALADLVEAGTIRIIDIAFASKDENGKVATFELGDLDADVREALEKLGATPANEKGPHSGGPFSWAA